MRNKITKQGMKDKTLGIRHILSLLFILSLVPYFLSIIFADPGADSSFGNIPKKISIQRGTAVSVWLDRGDVAKSSAMTAVGDGTWELFVDLTPNSTYNFLFFAVPTETVTGLTKGSTYYDTPPTDYSGTINFPTSTSPVSIVGNSTAWFGKAGAGDDRRLVYIPAGGSTYYVFANFAHTPNPPINIYAHPMNATAIKLTWNYPKDSWNSTDLVDVIAGGNYQIYYSTTGSAGPFGLLISTAGTATEYTHDGLNSNSTYYYVIVSSDAYRGTTKTGKVDQTGIDDNFVMAFPDLAQVSRKPSSPTPTYFRVDNIDWEKIGGNNAIVYLTPWDENAMYYDRKVKGRIVRAFLP